MLLRRRAGSGDASSAPKVGTTPVDSDRAASPSSEGHGFPKGIWWSRRAWLVHAALLVWVPGCVVACRWQIGIALSGNSLGWAYAVMWPCLAVFGAVVWWHVIHDDPETVGARGLKRLRQATEDDTVDIPNAFGDEAIERAEAEDAALASYNAYLAQLARDERPRTWRRR